MSRPEVHLSVGVGIERIERLIADNGGIERRVFTDREISYRSGKRRRFEHPAACLAAEEAVLKAIATGLGGRMRWTDVEVVHGSAGRPHVELEGEVSRGAGHRRIEQSDASLSHTRECAVAEAVAVSAGAEG